MMLDAAVQTASQSITGRDVFSGLSFLFGVFGAAVGYISRQNDRQREQLDMAKDARLVKVEAEAASLGRTLSTELASLGRTMSEERVRAERVDGDMRVMRTEHSATKAAIEDIRANMVMRPEFEQGVARLEGKMDILLSREVIDRGSHPFVAKKGG